MAAVSRHAACRARERVAPDLPWDYLWQVGRPATCADFARYGIAPYEGRAYRIAVWRGQALMLVAGRRFVTVIKLFRRVPGDTK